MNGNNGAGFIKLSRNPVVEELMQFPFAFLLLTQIARRAMRVDQKFNPHNLSVGQALIGDRQSIGASEQNYRTAKDRLDKWGFATFRPTNKGTIATLSDTRVFDINIEQTNDQSSDQDNGQTASEVTSLSTTKKKKRSEEPKKKRTVDGHRESIFSEWPGILQTDAFKKQWIDWESHRKEIKKPLTKTSLQQQLDSLAEMGEKRAIAALKHTIFNGWQGIREPDSENRPTGAVRHRPRALSFQEREKKRGELTVRRNSIWKTKVSECREFTPTEQAEFDQITEERAALYRQ